VKTKVPVTAPWFDEDCRRCKAATRRLEKAYRRTPSDQSKLTWRLQFHSQRELFQKKLVSHWSAAIEACGGNSQALWSKLRRLLQPQSVIDSRLTADDFAHDFLSQKLTVFVHPLLPHLYTKH